MTEEQAERRLDAGIFETEGPSWAERARFGELRAVISPNADDRLNLFLDSIELYGAKRALRSGPTRPAVLDFGCGNGRFLRYFGARGSAVVGTEITPEMIEEARRIGLPTGAEIHLTDGIHVPLPDNSVDLIWACGVLKFSLFRRGVSHGETKPVSPEPDYVPVYPQIVKEMSRVLRPDGRVVNVEVYVDAQPVVFTHDFEQAGFVTEQVSILHRYYTRFDRLCWNKRFPLALVGPAGRVCADLHRRFADPGQLVKGLRDYLFVWRKPGASR